MFNSLRNDQTLVYPKAVVPLCIPASSVCSSSFYTSSLCSLHLFIPAILAAMKWHLTVVLISISLMTDDVSHRFHGLLGHLCNLLGESSVQILCLFLNWVIFLLFSHMSYLYILHTNVFQVYDLQIFSLILWVAFSLPDGIL